MSRQRILVLSTDPLTERMPGPAIRAWHLALLLARDHEVVLGSTVACTRSNSNMSTRFVDIAVDLDPLESWMDVLIAPAGVLGFWPALSTSSKIIIFDVYDPYHLEHLEPSVSGQSLDSRSAELILFSEAIFQHLEIGDFFICASARQRDFWLGSLMAAGRINPWTYDASHGLERLIDVVPFGMSADPPIPTGPLIHERFEGIESGDDIVLWGGGIYNWFDPEAAILAIDALIQKRPTIRLVFMGAGHPNPAIPGMRVATNARALSDHMALTGKHVFFNEDWVPYEERAAFLLSARIGISTHLDHLEAHYSFRTRVLDYLWAGLPMVLTSGDVLAALVEAEGVGVGVPASNIPALVDAIDRTLEMDLAKESFNALQMEFLWANAAAPLLRFCRDPLPSPDRHLRLITASPVRDSQSSPKTSPTARPTLREAEPLLRNVPLVASVISTIDRLRRAVHSSRGSAQ